MTKLAGIIGGVVLLAGVALAGTLTSLGGSTNTPAGNLIPPPLTATLQQDDRGREVEQRGREAEPAEREDEVQAGEDLRGPCDEAEHANDPRCTGAPVAGDDDEAGAAERGDDRSDHDGSGHDRSGHGGDDD
jgi:hypothetical protein